MNKANRNFTFIDHTADIGILVQGAGLKELFQNAGKALLQIMIKGDQGRQTLPKNLSINGSDYADDIKPRMRELVQTLFNHIPTGVGSRGSVSLNQKEIAKVAVQGARWAVQNGFGDLDDLEKTEDHGVMTEADPTVMHLIYENLLSTLQLTPRELGMQLLYDVSHNIAKKETHLVNGKSVQLCVHRKGATRSLPPDIRKSLKYIGKPAIRS
ncbi:MAG: hypothetical protein EHM45_17325 [Desulfobacteraceae bacterium]|nr:MAG: hypothetical protein EHM45_17325 [Desulfobacteraceae bacterium]